MQLPAKVSKTLRQDLKELLGIVTFFEPHDHIVKPTLSRCRSRKNYILSIDYFIESL
jgi:hypothetical protein